MNKDIEKAIAHNKAVWQYVRGLDDPVRAEVNALAKILRTLAESLATKCANCGVETRANLIAVQNDGSYHSPQAEGCWQLVYCCEHCSFRWVNEQLSTKLIDAQLAESPDPAAVTRIKKGDVPMPPFDPDVCIIGPITTLSRAYLWGWLSAVEECGELLSAECSEEQPDLCDSCSFNPNNCGMNPPGKTRSCARFKQPCETCRNTKKICAKCGLPDARGVFAPYGHCYAPIPCPDCQAPKPPEYVPTTENTATDFESTLKEFADDHDDVLKKLAEPQDSKPRELDTESIRKAIDDQQCIANNPTWLRTTIHRCLDRIEQLEKEKADCWRCSPEKHQPHNVADLYEQDSKPGELRNLMLMQTWTYDPDAEQMVKNRRGGYYAYDDVHADIKRRNARIDQLEADVQQYKEIAQGDSDRCENLTRENEQLKVEAERTTGIEAVQNAHIEKLKAEIKKNSS